MKHLAKSLYAWVLFAIIAGGFLGYVSPSSGIALKPISDGFIALIKMLIGPVIFCTVVLGIAGAGCLEKLGRVGIKSLFYFEIVSTLALAIGLLVGNIIKPGSGFHIDPSKLEASKVTEFSTKAHDLSITDYILHIIPKTFSDAFTGSGDLLQILLVAILFGISLARLGEKGQIVVTFIEASAEIFFAMVNMVMKLAPLGAGAAMAYTIGKFGIESLKPLLGFIALFYGTCIAFIIVVLGAIAKFIGFNIFSFLRYIKTELLTVLGTSSSESALVPLMEKLEKLGCSKSVVGIVIPSGYSFNLDGTNIYLSMAVLFVAQALDIDLTLQQQLGILIIAMLTSKGASGVTGSGFITLAATLAVVPQVPVVGLALILGVDRFMSEARALTNIIGNGVATIAISKWENELDAAKLDAELDNSPDDKILVI
jgi:aerobic C4-dicarboxylate transport protein